MIQKFHTPFTISKMAKHISFLLLVGYVCVVVFRIPKGIELGLDPSWRYGLSHATEQGLIFGKDIIFTYGPLGFLVEGAVLEGNFSLILAFRLLIHLGLFAIALIKIYTWKGSFYRIILSFSLLFSYFSHMLPEYEIVCIWILILSFNQTIKKNIRTWSFILGCLSGFILLTKFTLGMYTFGSLILFLLVSSYQEVRRSSGESKASIFLLSCFDATLSSITIAALLFIPQASLQNLKVVLIGITVSGLAGAVSCLCYCWIKIGYSILPQHWLTFSNRIKQKAGVWGISLYLGWVTFYSIYCLYLITQSSNISLLLSFVDNSLEVAQGYSSAMSVAGNPVQAYHAFLVELLLIGFMGWLAKKGHADLSLPFCFILFLSYKHGFVRQDMYHTVNYFALVSIILSVSIPKMDIYSSSKKTRFSQVGLVLAILFFNVYIALFPILDFCISSLYVLDLNSAFLLPHMVYDRLIDPNRFINNASLLLNVDSMKRSIHNKSLAQLETLQLPDKVVDLIGSQTVDVMPWEISITAANRLNWKPRPIFQSYSAYSERLDNINFDNYKSFPRDYIIYNFDAIDKRHPFFDEPRTFSYVFCHYMPLVQVTEPDLIVYTPLLQQNRPNLIVLKQRSSSRCSVEQYVKESKVAWDRQYPVKAKNNEILRAKIQIHYSFLGKLYKTFFRSPPVYIVVNYGDGQQTFRIIPENSGNGVIVSHLPKNDMEALAFLKGDLSSKVRGLSLHTESPVLYQPMIEISLSSETLQQ
jgi:hypothetical protein